jgi:hypothetical protein
MGLREGSLLTVALEASAWIKIVETTAPAPTAKGSGFEEIASSFCQLPAIPDF